MDCASCPARPHSDFCLGCEWTPEGRKGLGWMEKRAEDLGYEKLIERRSEWGRGFYQSEGHRGGRLEAQL